MKNLHTKLEQYSQKCDEILLSKYLIGLIKEGNTIYSYLGELCQVTK